MKKYYIAVDGGGTSTVGILADEERHELKRLVFPATNPNDVGYNVSVGRLKELISGLSCDQAVAVCAGVAGAGVGNFATELNAEIGRAFPGLKTKVVTDAEIMFRAGIPSGDGACVISGTGSVCYVRRDGEYRKIGGWGNLFDNGGSGYDIGRDGISAVLAAHDGRGAGTLITGFVNEKLGGTPWDMLPEFYRKGKPFIASFSECVFNADALGDRIAGEILDRNAACLAEYLRTAELLLGCKPFKTVLGGGVIENNPSYFERLKRMTVDAGINTEPSLIGRDPVFGALEIALSDM